MTTITAPETAPAGDAAEPRIDRKAIAYTLRGWGCWASLAAAVGYIVLTASTEPHQSYALYYGPAFVLGALTTFAWRYQDGRRKTTGRRDVASQAPALLVTATVVASLIGLGAAAVHTGTRPSAQADYAKAVGYAPGYSWDTVAAGYWACGELSRGAAPEAVVDRLLAHGDPQGNRYTALKAAAVVDNAGTLCPNVTR